MEYSWTIICNPETEQREDFQNARNIAEMLWDIADSVHERPEMIRQILEELGENAGNSTFKIDLNKFEEKFIEAHTPYDKAIKILCFECHRKYDSEKEIIPLVDEEVEQNPSFINAEEILEDMEEVKIGQLVRQIFFEKIYNLPDNEIENLLDPAYSKENFDINYSVLKEYRDDKDAFDENGKMRYFSPKNVVLERNNREFLLTNHWFKKQEPLIKK